MFTEQKFNLFLTQLGFGGGGGGGGGFAPPPPQKKKQLNLRCDLSDSVYST